MPVRTTEEHGGRVARLVLDAPPDNALTVALLQELDAALQALAGWPDLVCVTLEGAGRDFCAGLSLSERRRPYTPLLLGAYHGVVRRLAALDVVRLAKVRGRCAGAGLELTLLCHAVLADPKARFSLPDVTLAAFPTVAPLLLAERVGRARADDLLLSGRELEAAEALAAGLVTAASSGWEDLDTLAARHLETAVLSRSAPGLRALLHAVQGPLRARLDDDLAENERLYLERVMPLQDAEEGLSAALRGRAPKWRHG
jgi:cyclohexa-1,5-dienecarbonyl-CoA hydratase